MLLGPWAGAVVIAAVFLVQCFMFADGGVTALGANFVNMGLIGSVGGYAIYAPIRRAIGGDTGSLDRRHGRGLVLGAAGLRRACALSWRRRGTAISFLTILAWMALVHAVDRARRGAHHRGRGAVSSSCAGRISSMSLRQPAEQSPSQCEELGPGDCRRAWGSLWRSRSSWRRLLTTSPTASNSSAEKLDFLPAEDARARIHGARFPITSFRLPAPSM